MNKLTRKITLSLIAVIIAVLTLGTSTFAWFTLGTTATVESVSAEVTSGDGIEVSVDQTNWYTTLAKSSVDSWLSGHYGAAGYKLIDLGKTKDGISFTKSDATVANDGDYVMFPIYMRSVGGAKGYAVKVSELSISSKKSANDNSVNAIEWQADVSVLNEGVTEASSDSDYLWEAGKTYTYYAEDAARISFVYNNSVKLTAWHDTTGKSVKDPDVTASTTVEGTTTEGTAKTSGSYVTKYASTKGFALKNVLSRAADATNNITEIDNTDDSIFKQDVDIKSSANLNVLDKDILDESGNTVVWVYIWLNGFDSDCINAILGGNITVEFKLEAYKAA